MAVQMISDLDIWRSALIMVKRYGDDAMLEAAARADQLQEEGDWQGALTWHHILDAIERLQAKVPAEGETTH
jgi:hypothetical protein